MRKRTFIIGLVCWLGFFGFGLAWTFSPYSLLRFNDTLNVQRDSHEFLALARREFPIHLAAFEKSGIRDHADRIANEDNDPPPEFDSYDWVIRETWARGIVLFLLWLASGWFVHWFVTRIIRGPGRLVR